MLRKFKTIFVLGGPGSGKGTQCELIEKRYNLKHLSAGQLLRQEQSRPQSEFGSTIDRVIKQGKIVPSHITIALLKAAMRASKTSPYFLIDGFPRNLENFNSWNTQAKDFCECSFVLHFQCSREQMIKRLLKRSQSSGRSDDNLQVINKRFATYYTETYQVIKQFQNTTTVHHINSDPPREEIFQSIKPIFQSFLQTNNIY